MNVRVYATPDLILPGDLTGTAAVVIDVLRMTTVAATAVQHGCAGLYAVDGVEAARRLAKETGALTGGERNALRIEGFDFDNSPLAYTEARVGGRRLVMTTSNGTRAIAACESPRRVLLGAFVNAMAVAEALRGETSAAIVCAGTLGHFTLEDALAAGALVYRLRALGLPVVPDDMAIAAEMLYDAARADLSGALSSTAHYRRLARMGFAEDIAYCLSEDVLSAAPERKGGGWFA